MVTAIDWAACRAKERDACAKIAENMARDLEESVSEGVDPGPYTAEQVLKGYRMIAKLIRSRSR